MKLLATGCSGGLGKYIPADTEIDFRNFQSNNSLSSLELHSNESTLIHLAAMTSILEVQGDPVESFKDPKVNFWKLAVFVLGAKSQ